MNAVNSLKEGVGTRMFSYFIGQYVEYMVTELYEGKYANTYKGNIGNWYEGHEDAWRPVSTEDSEKLDAALNRFKYND